MQSRKTAEKGWFVIHNVLGAIVLSCALSYAGSLGAGQAPVAANIQPADSLSVIIQTEQSTDTLVAGIEQIGGKVRTKYRNIKAVATTVPANQLAALSALPGVTRVARDILVSLPEEDPNLKSAHPFLGAIPADVNIQVRPLTLPLNTKALPQGYINYVYTGAASTWPETGAGEGSIVAVIDTGVARNTAVAHAVIGSPGLPDGYNAVDDGVTATYQGNNPHGTWVAGVIAGLCQVTFPEGHPFGIAIETYLGLDPTEGIPMLGQAPGAKIYPVKVFDKDSTGGTSVSYILDGMDHVITLKKTGALDIDIVNMSLGWFEVWDGHSMADQLVDEMTKAGILVVVAAGNSGPTCLTVGTPASAFSALAVGGLDYAPSSRVLYEVLGLLYGPGPGQGMISRPTDEVRVSTFSSRGPLHDGRLGPRICALASFNTCLDPYDSFWFLTGTSLASPTVAGAAALLNSYWEKTGRETDPPALMAALLRGANPQLVGAPWQNPVDQGYGALDVPAALKCLRSGNTKLPSLGNPSDKLRANVLGKAVPGKSETWVSEQRTLLPSESWETVIEVFPWTSKISFEFSNISAPANSAYATQPNQFVFQVIDPSLWNLYASTIPPEGGESISVEMDDGLWSAWAWGSYIPLWYHPMQQGGLVRISAYAAEFNESPASAKLRVTRENFRVPPENRIASGLLKQNEVRYYEVQIPEGIASATFQLNFHRDWAKIPTSNIDLYLLNAASEIVSYDAATLSVPERATLSNPEPGTYYVLIVGATVDKPDEFEVFLTLE